MADFKIFVNNFMPLAAKNGFAPAHFIDHSDTDSYRILYKHDASIVYFIYIYDNITDYNNFFDVNTRLAEFAKSFIQQSNLRHMIVYNIIVSEVITDELEHFVDNSMEYFDQEIYEINYLVLPDRNRIGFSKKQPHKINNVMDWINKSISDYNSDDKNDSGLITPIELSSNAKNFRTVYVIMLINLIVLILMELSGGSENRNVLISFGAMNMSIFQNGDYYRVFTATFLHIGFMHFIYNSLALYIFGTRTEKYFGSIKFLVLYIISAVIGNFMNSFFSPPLTVLAGASGGIYGLLGACLAMTQVTKRSVNGLSFYSILIFALSGVLLGFANPSIGNIAHLGGLLAGYLIGLILTKLQISKAVK